MWSSKVFGSVKTTLCRGRVSCRTVTSAAKVIDFNTKHLAKGDPLPPYNGTMRVYNMRFCPFAQRTILALNAKEIEYEVINVNLMNKPDWLFKKSCFGKVPAIEMKEDVTVYESLVTVEYLDEVYPNRPLLPKDPMQRASDKIIVEASGAIHNLFFKLVKRPETINEINIAAFHQSLEYIQTQLLSRGTKFLYGELPGYVDYMIWPWFERLRATAETDDRAKVDPQKYKLLLQYIDNMMLDPAVNQYLIPAEVFHKFHSGFQLTSGPDYDLLNKNKV